MVQSDVRLRHKLDGLLEVADIQDKMHGCDLMFDFTLGWSFTSRENRYASHRTYRRRHRRHRRHRRRGHLDDSCWGLPD